jgi:hypothetical protein
MWLKNIYRNEKENIKILDDLSLRSKSVFGIAVAVVVVVWKKLFYKKYF